MLSSQEQTDGDNNMVLDATPLDDALAPPMPPNDQAIEGGAYGYRAASENVDGDSEEDRRFEAERTLSDAEGPMHEPGVQRSQKGRKHKTTTAMEFIRYRLHERGNDFNAIHYGRRLTQEYFVSVGLVCM